MPRLDQDRSSCIQDPPRPYLMYLLIWLLIVSFNVSLSILVNISVSLSSASCSSKLIKLEEGVVRTSDV